MSVTQNADFSDQSASLLEMTSPWAITMHRGRLKTPHHCDKVLFEPLALEEAVWPDFGLLVASSVWFMVSTMVLRCHHVSRLRLHHVLTIVRFLALATSKDNGKTYL